MSERVELAVADHNCTLCHNVERAWAAGFFDGEGSSWVNKNTLAYHISVSQHEPKTLLRFQGSVGGLGTVVGPYAAGTKAQRNPLPRYRFQSTNTKNSLLIIKALWPYLSQEKRKQANAALRLQRFLRAERVAGRHPRKYGPARTQGQKNHE